MAKRPGTTQRQSAHAESHTALQRSRTGGDVPVRKKMHTSPTRAQREKQLVPVRPRLRDATKLALPNRGDAAGDAVGDDADDGGDGSEGCDARVALPAHRRWRWRTSGWCMLAVGGGVTAGKWE